MKRAGKNEGIFSPKLGPQAEGIKGKGAQHLEVSGQPEKTDSRELNADS